MLKTGCATFAGNSLRLLCASNGHITGSICGHHASKPLCGQNKRSFYGHWIQSKGNCIKKVKQPGFYVEPFSVVQAWCKREKEKCKCLIFKHLHFVGYPVDYLFSNQFMEDLAKIYRLRKYFPSFDDWRWKSPVRVTPEAQCRWPSRSKIRWPFKCHIKLTPTYVI